MKVTALGMEWELKDETLAGKLARRNLRFTLIDYINSLDLAPAELEAYSYPAMVVWDVLPVTAKLVEGESDKKDLLGSWVRKPELLLEIVLEDIVSNAPTVYALHNAACKLNDHWYPKTDDKANEPEPIPGAVDKFEEALTTGGSIPPLNEVANAVEERLAKSEAVAKKKGK